MKVRATMKGYYGDMLREPGDVFDLLPRNGKEIDPKTKKPKVITEEDQFSHEWMERMDGPAPARTRVMPGDIVPPPPPPSILKQPSNPGNFQAPPMPIVQAESEEPTGSQEVI